MLRIALAALLTLPLAAPVFADSSRALRDIALTSLAVRSNRTASARRAVLDGTFDAVDLDLRDAVGDGDGSVRGKNGSALRRNWFAKGEWYEPTPRRPYAMPELAMPEANPGVLMLMGASFKTAVAPWHRLFNAASRGTWSSVAIVRANAN